MSVRLFILFICFFSLSTFSRASDNVTAQQAAPVNVITQAAFQAGVLTCSGRINQVANFLAGNMLSGAVLFTPAKNQADRSIFSSSLELIPTKGQSMYASASFSPNGLVGGCGAVYDTVQYVNKSCVNVEVSNFNSSDRAGVIKKDIVILNVATAKFFLMPAGNGCVIIKKEIVQ